MLTNFIKFFNFGVFTNKYLYLFPIVLSLFITRHYIMSVIFKDKCIFCDIIRTRSTTIEFENDNIFIIKDIKPSSTFHYLAIPKNHINDATHLTIDDKDLVIEMKNELKNILESNGANMLDVIYGFHWPPVISVHHLHMHAISPVENISFINKWKYEQFNIWFRSPEYVISKLGPNTKL